MDQIKIGKFIAALRKEKGLTQEQLGEKLGVTNKPFPVGRTAIICPMLKCCRCFQRNSV